ncbi:HlyD family type I secretion periplasmic adaptor subunit [Rhizobium sp. L1K21]|uniref:HlyD family type I secretion periplasmic adaptor subunit n=1 Tax=Rhizobium sp. L1K21 TaxID=2954933 RepID=UPI002091EC5E|nr:HlyD family type I secretion periplasmic adaptor subunit [Rhizobium sp. L1K21]MCO6187039.1 HlyD family type I secretion periplasmic adaptor subunit [Rhizobium sp. L1K21]
MRIYERPPLFARLTVLPIGLSIAAFISWASWAEIDEIARGGGKVIPVSKTQLVQTSEAGIVQEIAVRLGERVSRGDLLVQLENVTTQSTLGEAVARARALGAKIARLSLEEAGNLEKDFVCPEDIASVAEQVCANEARLFEADRQAYTNKANVLNARLLQKRNELAEAKANIDRLQNNIAGVERQLEMLSPLLKKKLVAESQVLSAERELTDLQGQLNVFTKSLPRITSAIAEAELMANEVLIELKQEALADKAQALAELSVVKETIEGAEDRVRRTDIRSPVDGIVNTLDVNTIGAYVEPGSMIAGIVPTADTLLVEAKISPRDVAFVRPGQKAVVKISAYDFSIFGGLEGEVSNVSADSLVDKESGEAFYVVQIKTDKSELDRDSKSYPIIPGMIASVEILTGKKTILSYLLKPINKAREEALTER